MRSRLSTIWENIWASLWFLPSLLVGAALLLSSVLIEVDVVLARRQEPILPWLFSGTADAARTVLSVIAGSLITVISIAFSITVVAIVQASAQFTPRVLRQFTASRPNQLVLGTYIATFIYSLLVLRSIRSAEEAASRSTTAATAFVPALSITVALGLAIVCLGLLIFFIHHTAQSLQVAVILDRVRRELVAQIEALYPVQDPAEPDPEPAATVVAQIRRVDPPCVIRATHTGFLRSIDAPALLHASFGSVRWVCVRPQVGQFIPHGSVLAELDPVEAVADSLADTIRTAFVIDHVRSITQDPLFGIRQLVDIALKALSPGINDMTTAEYALAHLGDALGRLAGRAWPPSVRTTREGQTRVIFSQPTWAEVVEAAFSQIRHAARGDVHVTATLLHVLHELALLVPPGDRRDPLHAQVAEIRRSIAAQDWSAAERERLGGLADQVDAALRAPGGGAQPRSA